MIYGVHMDTLVNNTQVRGEIPDGFEDIISKMTDQDKADISMICTHESLDWLDQMVEIRQVYQRVFDREDPEIQNKSGERLSMGEIWSGDRVRVGGEIVRVIRAKNSTIEIRAFDGSEREINPKSIVIRGV